MSATESLLSTEKALAQRLIRTQATPHDFWLWLGGLSATPMDNIATWIDAGVSSSVKAVITPNLADTDARERINLTEADAWIAAIIGFVNKRSTELKLNCGHPFMAVSLLPLYRSLATRKLPEAVAQTRHRLAEMLALVGIAHELADEFQHVLQRRGTPVTSPHLILKSVFKIDLTCVASHCRQIAVAAESGIDDTRPLANTIDSTSRELPWAEPQLLWQIAGELIAKKAEIVLPRPWADVSIPWTAISDHWNALTHRLSVAKLPSQGSVDSYAAEVDEPEYNADDEIVSEMIDDLLAMQTDISEIKIADPHSHLLSSDEARDESPSADSGSSNQPLSGRAHASHGSSVGAPRMEAESSQEPDDEEQYPETDSLQENFSASVPKIAIVEIASQTDKIFTSLIRRQIATARSEERTVCLVAVCIESDDENQHAITRQARSNGLAIWQEKLVNWLADHPQVHEPLAFVTTDGNLVMSMLDIERAEATSIIRDGVVSVLGDKPNNEHGMLERVAIPLKYFAGIGSVSAPNANFAAEQLIKATWRCLEAAQGQGKATIKSIEVF